MNIYITGLKETLDNDLNEIPDKSNAIKGFNLCIDLVRISIQKLIKFISEHPFDDPSTEIQYFKHIVPSFYSQLFYYKMMYNLEIYRITEDEDDFSMYVNTKLEMIRGYLHKHGKLYRYYYSGKEFLDKGLFTSEKSVEIRDRFYCPGSRQLSRILACERFKLYLKEEIKRMVPGTDIYPTDNVKSKASKSDGIELSAAIHEAGIFSINDRPCTFKEVIERTGKYFNIDLKNYSEIDHANRSRYDISRFLNSLKTFYKSRAERLDDQNHQKR